MTTHNDQAMGHWIDGREVPSSGNAVLETLNPLDDSLYGTVVRGTVADIDNARILPSYVLAIPMNWMYS